MSETVTDFLIRMKRKDEEKGYADSAGVRTTREVAVYFGFSMSKARRELNRLYEAGEIEGYDGGRETLWASKPAPQSEGEG